MTDPRLTDTQLPDEDRELSPYTGWTRAHWERTADRMLTAVQRYATPGRALIHLPGPPSGSGRHSDGLEGYARTFLLAAFRIAGAGGADGTQELDDHYAAGLAAGTDPAAADRWPRMSDCNQAKVEAASIALGLHETRPWIWDRLAPAVQGRVVDWLAEMVGAWVPDNNWVWFQAVVEAFLRSVGGPWKPSDIEHTIDRTESWYAGGGWYADGAGTAPPRRNFDHYSGWAMHLYPLWYCRISGADAEPGLADRYRARLRDYLTDLQHLVGADGAPLHQGRSLTYRNAAAAAFWADQVFRAQALEPGLTRRIGSGMLRHFVDRGSLDGNGLLPLGWYGEHLPLRQSYSGPASPYWASKGFAGLLLPADHPVWTAVEQPLPVERGDFVRTLHAPGWVASGTRADGIVRIANHGADHADDRAGAGQHSYDPFYCRWAYSTATGPELGGPGPATDADGAVHPSSPDLDLPGGGPLDSYVALLDGEGRPSHRRPLHRLGADRSVHRARWPQADTADGPWLSTGSLLRGPWEVRAVRILGEPAPGSRLRIGGWAVAGSEPPTASVQPEAGRARVQASDGLLGVVAALHGDGLRAGVRASTGRTSFAPHAAVAFLETGPGVRVGGVYVAAVALGRSAEAAGPAPEAAVDGDRVVVRWPDGHSDELVLEGNTETRDIPQE
ncbi:DUF2264 domain-containing protein [Streptacidiphilus sp. N1-10]|uniref:DUF2264 domain-containing protein n=1 Tax=Streptacidiphilus jeojiensis TaxID=3229225 RepID=A0ABV6XZS3_9ACTN